jgi:hypothetical protein
MSYETQDKAPMTGPDTKAAFSGLILGAIVIFALIFSIVTITNRHYEKSEAPASQTP